MKGMKHKSKKTQTSKSLHGNTGSANNTRNMKAARTKPKGSLTKGGVRAGY